MGQLFQSEDCPICGKPMVMAEAPEGKGPRVLRCLECDPLQDEKTKAWANSPLVPRELRIKQP